MGGIEGGEGGGIRERRREGGERRGVGGGEGGERGEGGGKGERMEGKYIPNN